MINQQNTATPFFSVIIPTYNRSHILPETIASVLNQTFQNFEVIIVDDGSTDTTKELITKIANTDSRVRYIYQKNAERSAARNNGIKNAHGDYICFLDSDDRYLPEHLNIIYSKIENKNFPTALFFTNAVMKQNNETWNSEFIQMNNSPLEYMLLYPIIPARICVHKNILETYQFREDIVIVEDQVLWTTVAKHFPVFQINAYTVVYCLHEDNSINIKKNCFKPRLNGLKLLFSQEDMQGMISKSFQRHLLSDCYFGIARYYGYTHNYFLYSYNLLISLLYAPMHKQTKAKIHMLFFPGKHRI
jgi:glycosyltransferase involved in cell wall biosynthesis